jgi:hypothetical protein
MLFVLTSLHPKNDYRLLRVYGEMPDGAVPDSSRFYELARLVSTKRTEVEFLGGDGRPDGMLWRLSVDTEYHTVERIKKEMFRISEELERLLIQGEAV